MLELIEAGWDFSILKPRRLESRPYTAGALTYCSLGETSLDSRVRGDHQSREGRDARAYADYLPVMYATPNFWAQAYPRCRSSRPFSDRSLTPAGAGTLPYENWACWLVEEFEGDWGHSRLPWIPDCVGMTRAGELWTAMAGFDGRLADRPRLGTSPSPTFFCVDYRLSMLGR